MATQAGDELLAGLSTEGVDVASVRREEGASGTALISVAPDGANQIVVAPGANAMVSADDAQAALRGCDLLLASFEVPMTAVVRIAAAADRIGVRLVVNAAPVQALPSDLLAMRPILVVNEAELALLASDGGLKGARRLRVSGVENVVVTRGARGAMLVGGDDALEVPAYEGSSPVDTTGAGDTFCGVLAAWLAAGEHLHEAVVAANLAAGLSVGAHGARTGMPQRAAILSRLGR